MNMFNLQPSSFTNELKPYWQRKEGEPATIEFWVNHFLGWLGERRLGEIDDKLTELRAKPDPESDNQERNATPEKLCELWYTVVLPMAGLDAYAAT